MTAAALSGCTSAPATPVQLAAGDKVEHQYTTGSNIPRRKSGPQQVKAMTVEQAEEMRRNVDMQNALNRQ